MAAVDLVTVKKFLLVVGTGLLAFILGRALVNALASEETHVRWLLEDMIAGFNATRLDPCMRPLAREFVDEPSGADRELVKQALIHLFFTEKDPATKQFPYVAELPENELRIDVRDASPKTATLDCAVQFRRRRGDALEPAWSIRVHGELEKSDDGWRIHRTRHETLSGTQLK